MHKDENHIKPSVLIVDDNDDLRQSLRDYLRLSEFSVVDTGDVRTVDRLIEAEKVDIVLTDLIMPEKEGISLIMELRQQRPDIKILAMSGGGSFDKDDLLKMSKSLGANDIISKPFDFDDLACKLEEMAADSIPNSYLGTQARTTH